MGIAVPTALTLVKAAYPEYSEKALVPGLLLPKSPTTRALVVGGPLGTKPGARVAGWAGVADRRREANAEGGVGDRCGAVESGEAEREVELDRLAGPQRQRRRGRVGEVGEERAAGADDLPQLAHRGHQVAAARRGEP